MAGGATEAFGKSFGIAVVTTGADLGAAGDRIPGGVGPLDRCCISNGSPAERNRKISTMRAAPEGKMVLAEPGRKLAKMHLSKIQIEKTE
jgi:hypothetical protein